MLLNFLVENGSSVRGYLFALADVALTCAAFTGVVMGSVWAYFRAQWYLRQRTWRKAPVLRSKAFFYNAGGGITLGTVEDLRADAKGVWVWLKYDGHKGTWVKTTNLTHVTDEEAEYIGKIKLSAALKAYSKSIGVK